MEQTFKEIGLFLFGMISGMVIMIFVLLGFFVETGYKNGQVDYANGIIKYQLKEQPDKSMQWEKVE